MIEQNMRLLMRHFWLLCIHCTGCRSRLDWSSCQHSCIWDDIITVYCRPPVKLHMHVWNETCKYLVCSGLSLFLFFLVEVFEIDVSAISFTSFLNSVFLGVTQKKWNKKYYLNLKAFFCKYMYKPMNIYRGADQ